MPAALYVYHRGGTGNKNVDDYSLVVIKQQEILLQQLQKNTMVQVFQEVNDMNNDGSGGGAEHPQGNMMTGGTGRTTTQRNTMELIGHKSMT